MPHGLHFRIHVGHQKHRRAIHQGHRASGAPAQGAASLALISCLRSLEQRVSRELESTPDDMIVFSSLFCTTTTTVDILGIVVVTRIIWAGSTARTTMRRSAMQAADEKSLPSERRTWADFRRGLRKGSSFCLCTTTQRHGGRSSSRKRTVFRRFWALLLGVKGVIFEAPLVLLPNERRISNRRGRGEWTDRSEGEREGDDREEKRMEFQHLHDVVHYENF